MAHFYVVAQYVSPVLAWGFLGTDEELKQVCEYFKVDIHSFSFSILYFVFNLNYTHSWVNRTTFSLISQEMGRKTGLISILFCPRLKSLTKEMENVDPFACQIKDGKIVRFGFRPASSLISGGSACCSMLFCPRLSLICDSKNWKLATISRQHQIDALTSPLFCFRVTSWALSKTSLTSTALIIQQLKACVTPSSD